MMGPLPVSAGRSRISLRGRTVDPRGRHWRPVISYGVISGHCSTVIGLMLGRWAPRLLLFRGGQGPESHGRCLSALGSDSENRRQVSWETSTPFGVTSVTLGLF